MRICIVGGGGGASNAANFARRLNREAHINIFTDRADIGHQPCEIPFVLSRFLASWDDTYVFRRKFYVEREINVHFNTEVTDIIRAEKRIITAGGAYEYDKLILDLGAIPSTPPIEGTDGWNELVLTTNLHTAKAYEDVINNSTTAAIVGTGQIALEMAAVLKARNYQHIYLLGRSGSLLRTYLDRDMSERIEARVRGNGIDLILQSRINSIQSRNGKKILSLPDRKLEVDFVLLATGSRPNVTIAQAAGLDIGETGGIVVNEYLQTSDEDIYAIGDCIENWDAVSGTKRLYQTATNAARGGRIAATNAVLGNVLPYGGTTVPFIMEVFGYQVGTVGITESYASSMNMGVVSTVVNTATRRRSFGGKTIQVKLLADCHSRTLVGAQIISEEMVAGKIDRLSLAIAEKIPVERLSLIDTCYYPVVGTAYEPTVMALDEIRLKLDGLG